MTEEIMEQPAEEIREETVPETTEEVEDAAITAAYEAGRAAAALESDARIDMLNNPFLSFGKIICECTVEEKLGSNANIIHSE